MIPPPPSPVSFFRTTSLFYQPHALHIGRTKGSNYAKWSWRVETFPCKALITSSFCRLASSYSSNFFLIKSTASVDFGSFSCLAPFSWFSSEVFAKSVNLVSKFFKHLNNWLPEWSSPWSKIFPSYFFFILFYFFLTSFFWLITEFWLLSFEKFCFFHNMINKMSILFVSKPLKLWYLIMILSCLAKETFYNAHITSA